MAKTIIIKGAIKRKPGKMYFIDKAGNVVETTMNRKGGKKGRTVCAVPKKTASKKVAKKAAPKKKTTARKSSPKTNSKRGVKRK